MQRWRDKKNQVIEIEFGPSREVVLTKYQNMGLLFETDNIAKTVKVLDVASSAPSEVKEKLREGDFIISLDHIFAANLNDCSLIEDAVSKYHPIGTTMLLTIARPRDNELGVYGNTDFSPKSTYLSKDNSTSSLKHFYREEVFKDLHDISNNTLETDYETKYQCQLPSRPRHANNETQTWSSRRRRSNPSFSEIGGQTTPPESPLGRSWMCQPIQLQTQMTTDRNTDAGVHQKRATCLYPDEEDSQRSYEEFRLREPKYTSHKSAILPLESEHTKLYVAARQHSNTRGHLSKSKNLAAEEAAISLTNSLRMSAEDYVSPVARLFSQTSARQSSLEPEQLQADTRFESYVTNDKAESEPVSPSDLTFQRSEPQQEPSLFDVKRIAELTLSAHHTEHEGSMPQSALASTSDPEEKEFSSSEAVPLERLQGADFEDSLDVLQRTLEQRDTYEPVEDALNEYGAQPSSGEEDQLVAVDGSENEESTAEERERLLQQIAILQAQQNDSLRTLLVLRLEQFWVRHQQMTTLMDIIQDFGRSVGLEEGVPNDIRDSLNRMSLEVLLTLQRLLQYAAVSMQHAHLALTSEDQLQETPANAKKGASQEAIDELRSFQVTLESEFFGQPCPICLNKFMLEEKMRMLPCSHCFHQQCVDDWLKVSDTCPNCRIGITNDVHELGPDHPNHDNSTHELNP